MDVYRISKCEFINDLSGKGAALFGGRWNSKNTPMLYTAQSRSLAMLEAVVHLGRVKSIAMCMATITIPNDSIEHCNIDELPANWNKGLSGDYTKVIGDYFIRSKKKLALIVPSAVIPDEHNVLINPYHAEFHKVKLLSVKPIDIDDRLIKI